MPLEPDRPLNGEVRARIESIGTALPAARLTTEALLAECKQAEAVDLTWLTGVEERRVCGEGDNSRTLAIAAARNCLARSRWEAEDLDWLIFCGITSYVEGLEYQFEPQLSAEVAAAIGALLLDQWFCGEQLVGVALVLLAAVGGAALGRARTTGGES